MNLDEFTADAVSRLGQSLQGIVLFGSATTIEFVAGLSDLDFLFIVDRVSHPLIVATEALELSWSPRLGARVDIKVFSSAELIAAQAGVSTCGYFNGWGLHMLHTGRQHRLYWASALGPIPPVSSERLRADALERASFYMMKLRKLVCFHRSEILDGEVRLLSDADLTKTILSSCKNVIAFCLAHRGLACYTVAETLKEGETAYGNLDILKRAYNDRLSGPLGKATLVQCYELCERVYRSTVGANQSE